MGVEATLVKTDSDELMFLHTDQRKS